jgi:hypothetical protein
MNMIKGIRIMRDVTLPIEFNIPELMLSTLSIIYITF